MNELQLLWDIAMVRMRFAAAKQCDPYLAELALAKYFAAVDRLVVQPPKLHG